MPVARRDDDDDIKAKIDNIRKNSRCSVCGGKDEPINRIINEFSKLAHTEYKNIYDWVGMVIYWELCKEFHHTKKWYMYEPGAVLENVTQNSLIF